MADDWLERERYHDWAHQHDHDTVPEAHWGTAETPLPNWRQEPDPPDPDDEEIATPADVTAMLGFDPAVEPADPEL